MGLLACKIVFVFVLTWVLRECRWDRCSEVSSVDTEVAVGCGYLSAR